MAKLKRITYFEALQWGIKHIANNHGFNASTDDWEEEGQMCIWGGNNIPMKSDVDMMCEDLSFDKDDIYSDDFGIEFNITEEWMNNYGKKRYIRTGLELWKRYEAVIGV